jgi:hypothetical protein
MSESKWTQGWEDAIETKIANGGRIHDFEMHAAINEIHHLQSTIKELIESGNKLENRLRMTNGANSDCMDWNILVSKIEQPPSEVTNG